MNALNKNLLLSLEKHPIVKPIRKQRGIALYMVLVIVMISMLLALWSSRTSLFNEMLVGNDSDYRRTFEAAQAMLQDAELDIRGVNTDGTLCVPDLSKGDVCRRTTNVYFDIETKDLEKIFSTISTLSSTARCSKGICLKRFDSQNKKPQDFWNDPTTLNAMILPDIGARYGQFTGAKTGTVGNPILNEQTAGRGAWYWVEILPYVDPNVSLLASLPPGSNVDIFSPSRKKPWIFRITALARGLKQNTEVVLQSTLSLKSVE